MSAQEHECPNGHGPMILNEAEEEGEDTFYECPDCGYRGKVT